MSHYNKQDFAASQGPLLGAQKQAYHESKVQLEELLQYLKTQNKSDQTLNEAYADLESLSRVKDIKETFKGLAHFQKHLKLPDHSPALIREFQSQREGLQAQFASSTIVEDVVKMLSNGIQDLDELLSLVILLGRLGFNIDTDLLNNFIDKIDDFLSNEALTAETMEDFASIFAVVQDMLAMINIFLDKPEKTTEAVEQRFSSMTHRDEVLQGLQGLGLDTSEFISLDDDAANLNPETVEAMPYVQQFTQQVQALSLPKETKNNIIKAAESAQDQQGSHSDSEASKRLWLSVMASAILDDFKFQIEHQGLDAIIESITKRFPDDMLSLSKENV